MMTGHLRRLEKLEASMLPATGTAAIVAMTTDELEIRILDLSRRLLADPSAIAEDWAAASARVGQIEGRIRQRARLAQDPSSAAHLKRLFQKHPGFVQVLCGDEYDDQHMPRIMARRAALRARSDIAALIEEGSRA